jgi:hypothetical protein
MESGAIQEGVVSVMDIVDMVRIVVDISLPSLAKKKS